MYMATIWTIPSNISQYPEEGADNFHIRWVSSTNFNELSMLDGKSLKTERDLIHIARDPKHDITDKTYYLKLTNFKFSNLPNILSGIELKMSINRFGRITDDTVQLILNNQLIGENIANLNLDMKKIYGTSSDLWGTNLTVESLNDPSFGVVLRFKSHPNWPHKSSPFIDAIEIKIH